MSLEDLDFKLVAGKLLDVATSYLCNSFSGKRLVAGTLVVMITPYKVVGRLDLT